MPKWKRIAPGISYYGPTTLERIRDFLYGTTMHVPNFDIIEDLPYLEDEYRMTANPTDALNIPEAAELHQWLVKANKYRKKIIKMRNKLVGKDRWLWN